VGKCATFLTCTATPVDWKLLMMREKIYNQYCHMGVWEKCATFLRYTTTPVENKLVIMEKKDT